MSTKAKLLLVVVFLILVYVLFSGDKEPVEVEVTE